MEIYEGWKNHLLPKKELKNEISKVANERIAICESCFYHSKNRSNYKSLRKDDHCTDCGCTLAAKTKCMSCSCPRDKWKAVITKEEENIIDKNG
jgi:hypothetical protein